MGGKVSRHVAWKELLSIMVTLPNASKSLFWIASCISFMRRGTVSVALDWKRLDVATVVCIPVVLDTPFLAALTTKMTARMLGQWLAGATWKATLSLPSEAEPCSQPTYPPKSDRHAEPEPCLAMRERSVGEEGSS